MISGLSVRIRRPPWYDMLCMLRVGCVMLCYALWVGCAVVSDMWVFRATIRAGNVDIAKHVQHVPGHV